MHALSDISAASMTSLAAVPDVIRGAVMVLFIISAILVILVILAQEGKGGGLAGAFGGAGAETFGVKAGTVNKFTAWLAAAFLGLALLHAGLGSLTKDATAAPDTEEFTVPDTDDADAKKDKNAKQDPVAEDPNAKDGNKKDDGEEKPADKGGNKKDDEEKKPADKGGN